MSRPKIGEFDVPSETPNIVASKDSPGETVKRLDAAETRVKEQADAAERDLAPLERYTKLLRESGVSKEKAAEIVDSMLLKGYYEQDFQISPRIKARLRSRTYGDTVRLQSALEALRPVYPAHYDEIVYRYCLASSISSLGNQSFEFPDRKSSKERIEELFDVRLRYVESLGDQVVRILYEKLDKFDKTLQACLQEGAVENF